MMIKINLLTDKDKEERKLEEKMGLVIRTGLSLVFSLILLAGLLFSIEKVLTFELKGAQEEAKSNPSESMKDIEKAEDNLKKATSVSQKVSATAKQVPYWSKIFERLSADVPEGLRFSDVHIEKEHLKITGFSKTRNAFLAFQEKLRGEGFSNLTSPVSNLVSPDNFEFTVEVDVDKSYLNEL